ncbi:hypothetical protein Fcan01_00461 [Folsomia candida]|uniref:Uncharacterized protein n=1 Tax=Folsomia candida TaxID=158441 RepID=A0A226EXF2_FOLCA|nr:hypothetical protein Fcan01_00461 [Folsomia candida]
MLMSSIQRQTRKQINFIDLFSPCPISISSSENTQAVYSLKTQNLNQNYYNLLKRPDLLCVGLYVAFLNVNSVICIISPSVDGTVKVFSALFAVVATFCFVTIVTSWYTNTGDFVTLLNMLLAYERSRWTKESDLLELKNCACFLKYFLWLFGYGFSVMCPILLSLFNVADLKRPPFLGSIIIGVGWKAGVAHVGAVGFQTWIYFVITPTYIFVTANIFIASVFSLCAYLDEIKR